MDLRQLTDFFGAVTPLVQAAACLATAGVGCVALLFLAAVEPQATACAPARVSRRRIG